MGRRRETVRCEKCAVEYERYVRSPRSDSKHRSLCVECRGSKGSTHPRFKGGWFNPHIGRWFITKPGGGSMLRYRYVMEEHLGRALGPDETVHHINGDPTDDRIENLELLSRADHGRLHAVERWHGKAAA